MSTMISLENVTVSYQHAVEHVASFKEYIIRKLKNKMKYEYFHALNNVSLDVSEGEVLGLIGRNGAGKSTLLKVIAKVLKPTQGKLRLHGRVFPLLELGAGFDPELTGRENVYLNSAILGFKKADINKRFDRIVEFAGLEEFIDAPVRNYSTGMVSRLGFSIATDVQPEILIIDEVLSVGDSEFQKKSESRIQTFCHSGTTILLVSHDLDSVKKICHRVALLEHGQIKAVGNTDVILDQYKST